MCISRSQVWSRATERDVWKLGFTSVNFGVQGPRGAGRGWVWEKKGSGFEPVLQLSEAGLPRGASPFWPTAYYWWGWERFSSHLFKGWLNIDPDWSLRIILMESGVGGSMGELPWRESLCLSSVTGLGRQGWVGRAAEALWKGGRILLTRCIFMKEGWGFPYLSTQDTSACKQAVCFLGIPPSSCFSSECFKTQFGAFLSVL